MLYKEGLGPVVVGITGATGAIYGITLLQELNRLGVESHLVISEWGEKTILLETDFQPEEVKMLATRVYSHQDLGAPLASGSFRQRGMVVAPCSMKTLSAIACGYADNLISRAADVNIKERRPLVLLARETPLNSIHLENMLKLSRLGVTIMPPVPAFYHRPQTLQDIAEQTAGRALELLGIENGLTKQWQGL